MKEEIISFQYYSDTQLDADIVVSELACVLAGFKNTDIYVVIQSDDVMTNLFSEGSAVDSSAKYSNYSLDDMVVIVGVKQ